MFSEIGVHLSSILFFLISLREKLECQARFLGYQGKGLIASSSPPSMAYKPKTISENKQILHFHSNTARRLQNIVVLPQPEEISQSHSPIWI